MTGARPRRLASSPSTWCAVRDPAFALAYAGLADAHLILGDYAGLPTGNTIPKARAAGQRALDLNPALIEPRVALAHLRAFYDWDWTGAEAEFRRASQPGPLRRRQFVRAP